MAKNVIHDSANWASLWVKDAITAVAAGSEASLPGGSLAGAIGQIYRIGAKVGVIVDTPYLGRDGVYHLSIDTAATVRLTGISGTGTDGQTVYITSGGAVTLTVGTNTPIGYLDQPKLATGDDLYLQLVPGAALPVAAP